MLLNKARTISGEKLVLTSVITTMKQDLNMQRTISRTCIYVPRGQNLWY